MNEKKTKFSIWSNFKFASNKISKTNKFLIVLRILLLISSIFISLYFTYENKLLLDILEKADKEYQLILMIVGICILYGALHLYNVVISRIYSYYVSSKVYYQLYLTAYNDLKDVDYDKLESPDYKNLYNQYKKFSTGTIIGEFNAISKLIEEIIKIVVFGSMVYILNPVIAIGIIVLSVFHYLIKRPQINLQHKMDLDFVESQRKFGYSTSVYTDFANAKEVRLYNMGPWLSEITNECMEDHKRLHSKLQWASFGVGFSHQLLRLVRDGAAYIYLIFSFKNGNITPGEFVLFFTAITNFSNTINGFSEIFNDIHKYNLQINDMRKLQALKSSRNRGKGLKIPYQNPTIEFRNVSFRYPNSQTETLHNISLKINFGEKIAIVGVNGAGKTTLIKLLCGLYTPTNGEILLNGRQLNDYNIEEYYSLFSAVFQDINIMPLSILQNIACTTDTNKIDKSRVIKAVKLAGLFDKVSSLENGLDTLFDKEINKEGIELSGGEKQKIALARAIYLNRPVLILDEPTSALDPLSEVDLYFKFNEISSNKTAVFISHRLASTKFCDRIIHIENGSIIEEGSHMSLMAKGGKYSKMFNIQKKYYEKD